MTRNSKHSRFNAMPFAGLVFALAGCTPTFDEQCEIVFDNRASLTLPVARSASQRKQGLQERNDPAPGMIFIWPEEGVRSLWMKNTPAPLSAAWIGAEGQVQSIIDMQPLSTDLHSSTKPVAAVIEVPLHDFNRLGIVVGDRVVKAECLKPRNH